MPPTKTKPKAKQEQEIPKDIVELARACASSPAEFRKRIYIDADGKREKLADVIQPFQKQDFEAMDPAWRVVAGRLASTPIMHGWIERPRGHSKTSDLAVSAAWAIAFSPKSRPIRGIVAAGDKEQASYLKDQIDTLVRLNPWLGDYFIEVGSEKVVSKQNGSELVFATSAANTSFGANVHFIIVDELTHWKDGEGERYWGSLFSTADKRTCLLLVISNAGYGEGTSWQWNARENARTDPSCYFNSLPGPVAPWITKEKLERQRKALPEISYRRYWLNQWTSGEGDALSGDAIEAAFCLAGETPHPEQGYVYIAGLDLSAKHDHTCLFVLGKHVGYYEQREKEYDIPHSTLGTMIRLGLVKYEDTQPEEVFVDGTGRLKMVYAQRWIPSKGKEIVLKEIQAAVLALHQRYRFASVGIDTWQSNHMRQLLNDLGVPVAELPPSSTNNREMAISVIEHFNERSIELFDTPAISIKNELLALRVVETANTFRLDSKRSKSTGHGDMSSAMQLAVLTAKRVRGGLPLRVRGSLVYD